MRFALSALPLLAALAAPASAQEPASLPQAGITGTQARSLPPDELAERAFRQVAARMQSMTRPSVSPGYGDEPPFDLVFATAPRSAGDSGQCLATVVHIGSLRAPDRSLTNEGVIATEIVYKVIGDVEAEIVWTEGYSAQQNLLCASAGPVIPADAVNEAEPVFFHFSGARLPTIPLIALQRAIRGARAGSYTDVACSPDAAEEAAEPCRDPKALLGGFDLANLRELEVSRPGQRETQYRIEAVFRPSARVAWRLTLDMDFSVIPPGERVFRLGHGEIEHMRVDIESEMPLLPQASAPGTP